MKQIPLTRGKFALVDDEHYDRIMEHNWWVNKAPHTYYAQSKLGTRKNISLHTFILNPPKGMVVDHIDGDGLNCLNSNMRICTVAQNSKNRRKKECYTSKYRGVHYSIRHTKYTTKSGESKLYKSEGWVAQIKCDGKYKKIGVFKTEKEAAERYNEYAKKLHGEFNHLNNV